MVLPNPNTGKKDGPCAAPLRTYFTQTSAGDCGAPRALANTHCRVSQRQLMISPAFPSGVGLEQLQAAGIVSEGCACVLPLEANTPTAAASAEPARISANAGRLKGRSFIPPT